MKGRNKKKKKSYTVKGNRGIKAAISTAVKNEKKKIFDLVLDLKIPVCQQLIDTVDAGLNGTIETKIEAKAFLKLLKYLAE